MQIRRFFCGEKDKLLFDILTKYAREYSYNKAYRNCYIWRFIENE